MRTRSVGRPRPLAGAGMAGRSGYFLVDGTGEPDHNQTSPSSSVPSSGMVRYSCPPRRLVAILAPYEGHFSGHAWSCAVFTLVELLVVIAIIAVLDRPAAAGCPEGPRAAQRSTCQNNLKQLGLALHNHYMLPYKSLPAAGTMGGRIWDRSPILPSQPQWLDGLAAVRRARCHRRQIDLTPPTTAARAWRANRPAGGTGTVMSTHRSC